MRLDFPTLKKYEEQEYKNIESVTNKASCIVFIITLILWLSIVSIFVNSSEK